MEWQVDESDVAIYPVQLDSAEATIDDTRPEPPSPIAESSVDERVSVDADVSAVYPPCPTVTFQVIEKGTQRRKTSLVDSLGFTYNLQSRRSYATYWQCTVRPKSNPCRASVIQRDGVFQPGKNAHNHVAEPGADIAAKIMAAVKDKALDDKFKPASAIVEEVIIVSQPYIRTETSLNEPNKSGCTNGVRFFIPYPIFVLKFLILDSINFKLIFVSFLIGPDG